MQDFNNFNIDLLKYILQEIHEKGNQIKEINTLDMIEEIKQLIAEGVKVMK